MGTRGQVLFGLFLVFLGSFYILGLLFNIDTRALFWPIILILIGVWLLARPTIERQGAKVILIGDYRRQGAWHVTHTDIWLGIGDVRLSFADTQIPAGETVFRINGLIGDTKVEVPAGIPVKVNSSAFVADTEIFDQEMNNIFTSAHFQSDTYDRAERKLRFDIHHFVGEVKVKHA